MAYMKDADGRRLDALKVIADTDLVPTKTGRYVVNGAGGSSVSTLGVGGTGATVRNTVRVPVNTTRWRLRIRNYDIRDDLSYSGQVDFTGVWVGEAEIITTGWNGKFAATPTQALTSFTAANLSTEYVTGWVTAAGAQFAAHKLSQISFGYTAAAATSVVRGFAGMYYTANQADAATVAPTMFANEQAVFDIVLEYEANTDAPIHLAIGDSLTVGRHAASDPGLGMAGSWPVLWGSRTNALVTNGALSGSTLDTWNSSSALKLTRWAGISWDAVIVALGTNQIENGSTLGSTQVKVGTTLAAIRAALGATRIYMCTVPPRVFTGDDAGKQVIRLAYNAWLMGLPFGIDGAFEIDKPVINPASTNTLDPNVSAGDGTHMNRIGSSKLATAVNAIASTRTR